MSGYCWEVALTKCGSIDKGWDYSDNYFPRFFHYKKDALALLDRVRRLGGKGTVEKVKGYF